MPASLRLTWERRNQILRESRLNQDNRRSSLRMSLVLDNLCVSYGKLLVLWNVSLEVNKGELVALVGSNGAGKSTLLRAIIGLTPPESGRIVFDGSEINSVRTHDRVRKGVAYVPEGRRLFYSMTVEENLQMGSKGDPKS